MLSLETLTDNPDRVRPPGQAVCREGGRVVTWHQLCQRTGQWRQWLGGDPRQAVAVRQGRGDELLAVLLAAWSLGKTAVMTASGRFPPSFVEDADGDMAVPSHLPEGVGDGYPALVMFTSGSTGAPKPVSKTLAQLDAELAMLESLWGEAVGDSLFVSTVSRHHMYGLPFGLLWPLARGNAFHRPELHFLEALPAAVAGGAAALITSPVQLANLPPHLPWGTLRTSVGLVFSAGAPLSRAVAEDSQDRFGVAATEIYGSTETGVIAWRQLPDIAGWHCLPGVEISADGNNSQLSVRSPALGTEQGQWLTLSDTGEIRADGSFELRGRIDSIIKVAGKRISLTAVERALQAHPWVRAARAVQLPERKSRIGAAVVLTAEANTLLIDRGRGAVRDNLTRHMRDRVDALAIPRYWRFLSALPVTREGKVPRGLLADLFVMERQPRLPQVLAKESGADSLKVSIECFVPHSLYYFGGHFSGNGILPGVVQIDWALHFASQSFGPPGRFLRLEAVKFQHVIQPGQVVTLALEWDPAKGKLTFRFRSPDGEHASGRVVFSHD